MWREGPLSLAYLTVDGVGPVEHVEAAAAAGFAMAGLRIRSPSHLAHQPSAVGNSRLIRNIRNSLAATGIKALDGEVLTLAAGATAVSYEPILDTAAAIGFAFLQVVGEDPDLARATDLLGGIAAMASSRDLGIALEFMRFRAIATISEAEAMRKAIGNPRLGILIDPLHLARSGGMPADIDALPPAAIAFAQLCDAPAPAPPLDQLAAEARGGRLQPGEGALPLNDLLNVLPDGLPLSVEVPQVLLANLPAKDRALRASAAARKFLARRVPS